MNHLTTVAAGAIAAVLACTSLASAQEMLGAYQARLSANDHQASDGYPLETAAQVVRQDRANWHKFGSGDPEDEPDGWLDSASARTRFEQMLNRSGAMSNDTRNAIMNGEPVVQVELYDNHVRVEIVDY